MFKDIVEENKKDAFEADAYSQEFLRFIPQLLQKVAESPDLST